MPEFAEPLARLIAECKRLPGIGQKSAQRIAFHLLRAPREDAERLAQALLDIKDKLTLCAECNNISDSELCLVLPRSAPRSFAALRGGRASQHSADRSDHTSFRGVYHVLHGAISPLRGVGPEQLKIKGLLDRLQQHAIEEIILATNPNVEGEATAVYLSRLLKPLGPACHANRDGHSGRQRS